MNATRPYWWLVNIGSIIDMIHWDSWSPEILIWANYSAKITAESFLSTERDVCSYIYDLLQNCSNSIVNALVLLNIAPSRRYYNFYFC